MNYISFFEMHTGILGLVSSFLMLLVTAIYAYITWWQAGFAKKTLLESIKQNREERQPYVVPTIVRVGGGAFDISTYTRVQLSINYKLENVGDSAAVTLYTFLYAKMEYQNDRLVYAHLLPNYAHSLKVGQEKDNSLHFETCEFRDIVEDLEICYTKNMKRIETDATVTPFRGPMVIVRTLYKNMLGQWFESVLEQELLEIKKTSKKLEKEINVDGEKVIIKKPDMRVTNKNIKPADIYEGQMINPCYSILTRRMVDYEYVIKVLDDCRKHSDSKLEYLNM